MNKKIILLTLFVLLSITTIGCSSKKNTTETDNVKIFKTMDNKDITIENIVGEWSDTHGSCFIFKEDKTYAWYLKETRDENFVQKGTFKIVELETYGDKNTKNATIFLQCNKFVIDGEVREEPFNTELVILEYNDNSMVVKNLNTLNIYTITKI